MNGLLHLLLRLQELDLLKRGLELASPRPPENCFETILPKRVRLRRQIPGDLLSEYDAVAQEYPDTMATLEDSCCSACGCAAPKRVIAQMERSAGVHRCGQCGRFLFFAECVPEYLSAG